MGRIAINVAGHPQNRRGVPFREPEVLRLVQEVRLRRDIIYGTKGRPAQPYKVRVAWQEIAEIISSLSAVERSAEQCRKRFNDIKRRGQMMVAGRKRGRPPKNPRPAPKPDGDIQAILESNKYVEPEDLEFEVQAPMDDDDPDYEPVPKKRESVKIVVPKEIPMPTHFDPPATASSSPPTKLPKPQTPSQPKPQTPSQPKPQTNSQPKPQTPSQPKPQTPSQPKPQTPSQPKPLTNSQPKPQTNLQPKPQTNSQPMPQTNSQPKPKAPSLPKAKVVVRKPIGSTDSGMRQQPDDEKHPFLELQQAGFDMLKRELSGFRDSVMSLNTRLNHLEVALRPIGHISDSLARIANAVERLTCPPE